MRLRSPGSHCYWKEIGDTHTTTGTALQVNIWFDLDAANYTAYMGGDTITRPHGLEVLSSTGVQGDLSWRNLTADKEHTLLIVKTPDDPSWTPTTPGKPSHLSFASFL